MTDGLTVLWTLISSVEYWLLLSAAVISGLVFGIMPGLGGKVSIAVAVGFLGLLDPVQGVLFLVAMHAVVHTGGSVPSILLGVPGTGADAATVVDGHPLAQRGEAGRALGAALGASALGGVLGAAVLLLTLPLLQTVLMSFGPAEFFLLMLLGLLMISSVSGHNLLKGLAVGLLGLQLSLVGQNPHTGEPRLTFDLLFLLSGVDVVTALLGIFAIPEIIDLARSRDRKTVDFKYQLTDSLKGVTDVFRHRWLAVRTSLLGVLVGLLPGLGGGAASWLCYGHAVQSARDKSRFGKGAIEGVIAPETANNAKEGGALVPTLFFGIPGSSGMAILIGALITLGVQPGPTLIQSDVTLVWQLIATLALANVIAAVMLLLLSPTLAKVTRWDPALLTPCLLLLVFTGVFLTSFHWQNFFMLLLFGTLGLLLKRFHWPRPPFALGLVLGHLMEVSFLQSLTIWGPGFVTRPLSLALILLIIVVLALQWWGRRRSNSNTEARSDAQ